MAKRIGEMNQGELQAIIRRQQQEIKGLRSRIETLKVADVGQLSQEKANLEVRLAQNEKRTHDLQVMLAMTQGLVFFVAAGLLALLGERFLEVLQSSPHQLDESKREELNEKLGEMAGKLVEAVHSLDTMSLEAWEKRRRLLEMRAATLPQPKRALFDALCQLALPSRLGAQLLGVIVEVTEFEESLGEDDWERLEILAAMLDTASNLWPLAVTNSLVPLLRFVGWDDAAEAAGDIIDELETTGNFSRSLVHRVQGDLIAMGAVEERTKPSTIHEFLVYGYRLKQSGLSPDQAAGFIAASPSQLKRAKRAFAGLEEIFDRPSAYPDERDLEALSVFSSHMLESMEEAGLRLPAPMQVELS